MPAPFPVALNYAHTGALIAPTDRELAEAGAIIMGADRRLLAARDAARAARRRLTNFFGANLGLGIIFMLQALITGSLNEGQSALILGLIAIAGGTIVASAVVIPATLERYTPEELAQLIGYVTVADGAAFTTPLGDRAVEAYEAWPKPLDPPLTVEEAAWKPLR